ncbi:MAG: hypothetical protein WBD20_10185 [Pirellulaceae bacterium]
MPLDPTEINRRIDEEILDIQQRIGSIRRGDRSRTERMQSLVQQRTTAFVDLAKHYLPELSHLALAGAWQEVQQAIGDVLLRKRDQRRLLQLEVDAAQSLRESLQCERDSVQEELDRVKRVLQCKTGNFRKLLRDDPLIKQWVDEIAALDDEIECCLTQHESFEFDAKNKLPAYEQSSLFAYLQEQNFGTPQYQGRGIQRRWDRWVAKLIGFDKAKKSYDFLKSTPDYLKKLIEDKQDRYRSLLAQLKQARSDAAMRHGTHRQQQQWKDLCDRVSVLDEQIEEAKWDAALALQSIGELDNVNGEYYDESLKIYQSFLEELEPEVLRVYAMCTESPIDDEICARLRNVDSQIDAQRTAANDHLVDIATLEKEAAKLRELSSHFHAFALQTTSEISLPDDFNFKEFLRDARHKKQAVDSAWQDLCKALLSPSVQSHPPLATRRPESMLPMAAAYAAASEFANKVPSRATGNISTVVLFPSPSQQERQIEGGFSTLAICHSHGEAKQILKLLQSQSISGFVHTHGSEEDPEHPVEVDIVVANQRYQDAWDFVSKYLCSTVDQS